MHCLAFCKLEIQHSNKLIRLGRYNNGYKVLNSMQCCAVVNSKQYISGYQIHMSKYKLNPFSERVQFWEQEKRYILRIASTSGFFMRGLKIISSVWIAKIQSKIRDSYYKSAKAYLENKHMKRFSKIEIS